MRLTYILFGRERILILPSRDAKPELIENADLVGEKVEVKYSCKPVIKAQRRIDFWSWQLV